MGRDKRLTLEQSQLLSRARTMGTATAIPIFLEDSELARLAAVILHDVGQENLIPSAIEIPPSASYYNRPLEWFTQEVQGIDFVTLYLTCLQNVKDFETYFKCLCEIHKRRRKYEKILSAQPLPTMAQISPRVLLEFGIIASPALASWMTWRKWFYDIDNRAAQETGYLFEPILASVLGGVSYGSQNSPVRRRNNAKKGRQVDCIVDKLAYEFKLRVTIAASGQGRFSEELDFAEDCKQSGFHPVLLVLDPTPSTRLEDLSREYSRVGGEAYIGDRAWEHLEEQAGETMARFVEHYVRRPIAEIDACATELLNLSISNVPEDSNFSIMLSNKQSSYTWKFSRQEEQALADNGDEEE
ncbi:ApaLI family restriction endonuclease [Scytonema sp. UIC 10036]|uniref:ApaLI family restriction endonuclease n=1 Tax=Scytonema sp. UIC 10036 TaxID=2304196 RepID=UPI0012DA3EBA|nr:ApaLI family restriction endonuclease [Scytonema sp. UIC 10036]MUG91219.1 ApaLI family restriction endonuclease [Scytonema sp. UIC 10036]